MLSLSDIVNVKVGIGRGVFEAPGATVIGGKKPSFNLEILKLFANGEQGFYQDPNDLSTMFQDAAGTTAVNASGQTLGLMLDKSKGLALGPEMVTATMPFNVFRDTATNTPSPSLALLQANTAYMVSVTVSSARGTRDADFRVKSSSSNLVATTSIGTAIGTFTCVIIPKITELLTIVGTSSGTDFTVSSISVKEIKGNHAYQTTSAARPILQDAPRRIDFDTVDDKLITNLPAQLTGCTVIRAVPNVGTQILTSQTIPATYEDNTDHCGLIVINRALTPSETSAITAEFNKRAGV